MVLLRRRGETLAAFVEEWWSLYDLKHAFASLLIHEGRHSIVEIARQLGNNPTVCLDVYAHEMAEARGGEPIGAEELIQAARGQAGWP